MWFSGGQEVFGLLSSPISHSVLTRSVGARLVKDASEGPGVGRSQSLM